MHDRRQRSYRRNEFAAVCHRREHAQKIISQRLRIPFVDTDEALVELTGSTVAALLEREGEAALRERELTCR